MDCVIRAFPLEPGQSVTLDLTVKRELNGDVSIVADSEELDAQHGSRSKDGLRVAAVAFSELFPDFISRLLGANSTTKCGQV